MEPSYDVFISYPWADRAAVEPLAQALRVHGLRVFVDDPEVEDFTRITTTITESLAASRLLLAYYSAAYPTRRACQWELTAAYLAAQREGDVSRRILVVNPEPTLVHLHPGELRDALAPHPLAEGEQAALGELAKAVADRVRAVQGPLGEVAPLAPARWLPTQGLGSTRFVGRLPEMWRIHAALHPDTTRLTVGRTGPAVAQLRGLGGVGKSLLAEEYALRFGAAYPGGVFWLRAYGSHEADRPATFEELAAEHDRQVRTIAARLGLPVADRSPDEVLGALRVALADRGQPCLWVVDDLPDGLEAPQVQYLLAPDPVACTLLTTRSRRYGGLAAVVELDVLPNEDALDLLTRHRPIHTEHDQVAADRLVADLGYHALAVDVAGAALRFQIGVGSFAEFQAALRDPSHDELEVAGELAQALPGGHEASIATTLWRSIRRLGPEGSDVLRLAAAVAAAPIPVRLITAVLQKADDLDDPAARGQATRGVAQAERFSLTSPTGLGADPDATGEPTVEGGWVVHALVARTIRFTDPDRQRTAVLWAAAVAVLTEALEAIVDPREHTSLRQVVPHARELARHPETPAETGLLGWVARYDAERGDYRSAELAYRQQWDSYQRLLGPEHRDTLGSMSNLASALHHVGDLAGARDLQEQVLEACIRLFGPEDPTTLISMNNLASTLNDVGDLAGARDLQQQVLTIRELLLGSEHPDTLLAMNNLATTLRDLGDLAQAHGLQERVHAGYLQLLGPEHPQTLTATSNLAIMLRGSGDLVSARDLERQILATRRRLLGPEHPDTLTPMSNLASTLHDLGDLVGSGNLHREVFAARRRLLGPEHPDTLTSMDHVAGTLVGLGEFTGARDLHQQVLTARQRALGPEHPDTLTSMNNLASALRNLGDLAGARELQERVLDSCKRLLGSEHRETLRAMNNLGETLLAMGNPTTARDLCQEALDGCRRLFGPEHLDTLTSINNVASALYELGDLAGARTLQEQVLEASKRLLGPEHPDTLRAMNNLGGTLLAMGNPVAAHDLCQEALDTCRRLFGPEHPNTRMMAANLVKVRRALA